MNKTGFGWSSARARTQEPSIVATVEGQQIPAKIFRMYLKNGVAELGLDTQTTKGREKLEQLRQGIVSELVDRALIEAEARQRNLTISDEAFNQAYKKAVDQMGGDSRYRAYLSDIELTDEEFRQTKQQELYGELLRDELNKDVAISEDEIKDFYDKEKDNQTFGSLFKQPERVSARHILIAARPSQIASEVEGNQKLNDNDVRRLVSQEIDARRRLAETLLARLRRGADFEQLARRYSNDPATRSRGGDLGSFGLNTHTARFDDAAFALTPGDISGVVETEYGFHILKVTEHLPPRLRALDEVRLEIHEQLLAHKQAAHLRAWLEGRRREAAIQIDQFYRSGELQAARSR